MSSRTRTRSRCRFAPSAISDREHLTIKAEARRSRLSFGHSATSDRDGLAIPGEDRYLAASGRISRSFFFTPCRLFFYFCLPLKTERHLINCGRLSGGYWMQTVVDLLCEMIAIDSRSSVSNVPLANFMQSQLENWEIERLDYVDAEGIAKTNVVAADPESTSPLAFAGHLDTVSAAGWDTDPFRAAIAGDRLTGLGAADMKGPIAAFLSAARQMDPRVRPKIVLTADEEVTKQGVREVVAKRCGRKRRRPKNHRPQGSRHGDRDRSLRVQPHGAVVDPGSRRYRRCSQARGEHQHPGTPGGCWHL